MSLLVAPTDPATIGGELKDLFDRHGRQDFAAFYDRVIEEPQASITSVIGRDEHGTLAAHVGWFPHRFIHAGRQLRAGLITNLLVAREQRTFFPAFALLRRLVSDARNAGLDLLYGDPTPAAQAVLGSMRFQPLNMLTRFAFPVSRRTPFSRGLLRMYHAFALASVNTDAFEIRRLAGSEISDAASVAAISSIPDGDAVRALHDTTLYTRRLSRWPARNLNWYRVAPRDGGVPALTLVRDPDAHGVAKICAVYPSRDVDAGALVSATVAMVRSIPACRTIHLWTFSRSSLASTLTTIGFRNRGDEVPVLALPLTPDGEELVRAAHNWEVTDLDCDR